MATLKLTSKPTLASVMPVALSVVFGLPLVLACESESFKPKPLSELTEIYWDLELNHHAVTLSTTTPYDTLTITAVARNYQGKALEGLPRPQYTISNTEFVSISQDGVLRAVKPTAGTQLISVIATLITDNMRHADTVLVKVVANPTPPVLASLSVDPIPPDSAKYGMLSFFAIPSSQLAARMVDTSGVPITDVPVYFSSSNRDIATIDRRTGVIDGLFPREVTLYASTTLFGVSKADTLQYRIGFPVLTVIGVQKNQPIDGGPVYTFFPSEMKVGTGAIVWWSASDTNTVDITFEAAALPNIRAANTWGVDTTRMFVPFSAFCVQMRSDCTLAGNHVLSSSSMGAARVFTAPGTYEYRSTIHGARGRIVVINES